MNNDSATITNYEAYEALFQYIQWIASLPSHKIDETDLAELKDLLLNLHQFVERN